jgi:hypothetical protein
VPTAAPKTYYVVDDEVWVSVAHVTSELGIEIEDLLFQLLEEDTRTIGAETCICSFGINTAIALAKRSDRDTSAFEAELERITQELN